MNRSRRPAAGSAALAGLAAATALLLAGCGGSSPSSPSSSGGSTSHPAAKSSSPSGSGGSGGSGSGVTTAAYFPVGAGYTWVYRQQGFGGKGTSTQRILSVTPSAAGQVASLSNTVTYPVKKTFKETLIFRPDGSIQVPLTQFANASVTLESGAIVWPSSAQLASGQPYHDTIVMKIDEAGHRETMKMPVTVVGQGTSSVTVPAGTYNATLIDETMATSVDGYKISIAVRTWVANGVGPVKSEVFSDMLGGSSATPMSTEELVSFTKG
jgi:hypothetical protein